MSIIISFIKSFFSSSSPSIKWFPPFSSAEIGISIGSGTDIAIESSDIVIVQDKLVSILNAIKLSKSIVKKIKQNLFWAFLYNIIGIPIAMGFFYPVFGYLLNPIIAGGAMALSSISVILNTLLLRKNIRFNWYNNMQLSFGLIKWM